MGPFGISPIAKPVKAPVASPAMGKLIHAMKLRIGCRLGDEHAHGKCALGAHGTDLAEERRHEETESDNEQW